MGHLCVRTSAILRNNTKIVLPEARSNLQTRPSLVGGFCFGNVDINHKSKIINLVKEVNNMKNEILVYNLPDGAFCGAFVIQKG